MAKATALFARLVVCYPEKYVLEVCSFIPCKCLRCYIHASQTSATKEQCKAVISQYSPSQQSHRCHVLISSIPPPTPIPSPTNPSPHPKRHPRKHPTQHQQQNRNHKHRNHLLHPMPHIVRPTHHLAALLIYLDKHVPAPSWRGRIGGYVLYECVARLTHGDGVRGRGFGGVGVEEVCEGDVVVCGGCVGVEVRRKLGWVVWGVIAVCVCELRGVVAVGLVG